MPQENTVKIIDMKKIVVLVDPVSAGLNLIEEALIEHDYIALFTLGAQRVQRYVPVIKDVERTALQVLYSDNLKETLTMIDPAYLERIISVIPASEPGVILASQLGKHLNLIHLNEKATNVCRDKTKIRKELRHLSLPTVGFDRCATFKECLNFVQTYQLPVVLKHPTGAGQNNIFICQSLQELELGFNTIISSPNLFGLMTDVVLIEEYLDGKEYAINFLVKDGKIRMLDTWQYEHYLFDDKNRLYDNISHFQKYRHGQLEVESYASMVVHALGIDFGFIHLEVIDDHRLGPVLVDMGARMIGGHFTSLIKKLGLGNPFKTALKLYDGTLQLEEILYNPKCSMSGVFLPIHQTGVVKEIKGIEEICARPGYCFHFCDLQPGQEVKRSEELGNMAATFYISAPKDRILREEIDFIKKTFEVVYH